LDEVEKVAYLELEGLRVKIRASRRGAVLCPECGVVRHGQRWCRRAPLAKDARTKRCPACIRTLAARPAGILRLPRALLAGGPEECLRLVLDAEEEARHEHPLERLMTIVADSEGLTVTTTGIHLAGVITGRLERHLGRHPLVRFAGTDGVDVEVEWHA
jgi:hypothetical protein